jgi:hypothetical protein
MDLMVTLKAPPPLQPATPSAATPEEVSLFMDSDVSFVTGQGLTMDAKMRTAQAPDITFSMVVAGDEVFIRLGGEGWVLLDQATARQATSEGMLGRQSQPGLPFLTANVPWEAVKVEDLGDEKSDGVAVRRLVYDVDLKKVWAVMPADEKQKLADLYLPDELAPAAVEDLGQMMEVGKIEVWIDSSGFTRRMILEMVIRDVGTGQGTMAIYSDTRMSRFNEPQAIQRPSEFRRMDEVVTQQSSPGS